MNSSGLPYMLDMNMICDPSGDHAGEEFVPWKRGQEIRWLVQHRIDADLRGQDAAAAGRRVASEGNARGVGRPSRRERDGVKLRELMLIFAVVIHGPDFLVAGSIADKRDLRAGDARQAAGKFADDFIGELVREGADLRIGDLAAIHFPDDRRQGSVAHIVQPGLNLQVIAVRGEAAEGQKLRRGGSAGPGFVVHFRGSRRALQRVVTLAHQFEDAAVIQVGAHHVAELSTARGCEGVILGREIGHGDARLWKRRAPCRS